MTNAAIHTLPKYLRTNAYTTVSIATEHANEKSRLERSDGPATTWNSFISHTHIGSRNSVSYRYSMRAARADTVIASGGSG